MPRQLFSMVFKESATTRQENEINSLGVIASEGGKQNIYNSRFFFFATYMLLDVGFHIEE